METREKVLAIYEAVLELLENGEDINSLKVSDITGRAGIGKGTAYDYFGSKEDIIVSAIAYDLELKINQIQDSINREENFEAKVFYIFHWIEKHFEERKCFTRFLRLANNSYDINKSLKEEMLKRHMTMKGPLQILQNLCEDGKREQVISAELPMTMARIAILSKITGFIMYMENRDQAEDVAQEEMKQFLYTTLLKDLAIAD